MNEARADQAAMLREELADLDDQVAAGDIDAEVAEGLRAKYTAELADLEQVTDVATAEDATPSPASARRLSGRALAGSAIVGVLILAIGVFAVQSLDSNETAGAEGVASDVLTGEDVDLSQITNEQMEEVVAENPDVVGMRLALARRYFEEGSFDKALDHYFEVLDRELHPEALANVGWMTYLSDRPDVAVGYLERALIERADYLPAKWFIANVYTTLGRTDEAVIHLVDLLESDAVPQEIREGARTLLEQIESA